MANEHTPLLTSQNGGNEQSIPKQPTPMPWKSVLSLMFCRLVEPIAFSGAFPFIPQMVADTGVAPSDVGYKAGIVESVFAICQFATILQWGRLSDKIGRKPVILTGLCGVALAIILFGFSRSFAMMVITRSLAGVLNGNVGVLKSSLGELTDASNEAVAFSLLPPAWTIGSAFGPLLGGYLSRPAERYPDIFGNFELFKKYKYALPCLVASLFPVGGVITAFFLLDESLPKRSHTQVENGDDDDAKTKRPPTPSIRQILTARVRVTLLNYCLLAFTSAAALPIVPLWLFTPVTLGGLGFNEAQIGKVLSVQAITSAVISLTMFAPIQKRIGTIGCFRVFAVCYVLAAAMFPLVSYIARAESHTACSPETSSHTWAALACLMLLLSLGNLCYSCNMLLINASAPSPHALGALNGICQMCSAAVRAAALFTAPNFFAYSINHKLLGGNAVWLWLGCCGLGLCGTSWLVTDSRASWRDEFIAIPQEEEE